MRQKLTTDEAWGDEIARFRDHSGRSIAYPQAPAPGRGEQYAVPFGNLRAEVDAWNLGNPDRRFELPDNAAMQRRADAKVKAAQSGAAAASAQPHSLLGVVGGFAGEMGAAIVDPINVGTLIGASMLGAPAAAGTVRAFLQGTALDAAGMGAGQVVNEGMNWSQNQRLDPEYSLRAAAGNVGGAVVTGAEFGAGQRIAGAALGWTLRKTAQAWRDFRAGSPEAAIDRPTMDAGNVATHAANVEAANPFPTEGEAGAVAHAAAVADATRAAEDGTLFRPGEEMRATRDAAFARRPAEVAPAPEVEPGVTPEQMARRVAPELFTRTDVLDADISAARSQIVDLTAQLRQMEMSPPVLGESRIQAAEARVAELRAQFDAFTGKRRSSPPANALRDQIASARAEADAARAAGPSMNAQGAQKIRETIDILRNRIVDKTNDRAQLGPDVNAATAAARARLDARAKNEAGRVRNAAARGEVPPGADFSADLDRAQEIIHEAAARGEPVGQTLAGKDFIDDVNPRVRALVGLLHENERMDAPLAPEAAAERIRGLADGILADHTPPAGAAVAPETPRVADRAALDATADKTPGELTPDRVTSTVMDANRLLLDNPNLEVPVHIGDDATGQPIHQMMKLSDVLDQAEAELKASKDLKACALGRSE